MTDTISQPPKPLNGVWLTSVKHGGYVIHEKPEREGYYMEMQVACSTLDEALKWLKKAMEK